MQADGVFSGGGIKGLAFAGALQAAAEAGYDEWVQLAGTSAGAITAMALAVGYDAQGLRDALDSFDLSKIADYGPLGPLEIPINLELSRGATHGKVLSGWIADLLSQAPRPARTFGDLAPGALRVVGVDLAHTRMVVFPEDVALYVDEHDRALVPGEFPIAEAVRISAGYPYFFPPRSLRDAQTGKQGVLVDGGVASPYPVFLFDHLKPQRPTWGFRLFSGTAPEQPSYTKISGLLWPIDMLKAIVDTSMNALDKFEEREYHPRTISLPTGDTGTLDFGLTEEQKAALYQSGYEAAKAFFDGQPTGVNTYGAVPANLAAGGGGAAGEGGAAGGGGDAGAPA
ncbi:MAG: patatin-like phospholipase family protein [Solirubrobacteraceae bacterium]